ncbi:MAG: TGS domain-containing protein, partial [Clostridia bacterium]|nr:TGS domain-containing protein [Clostridia bacterium]
MIKVSLKDGSQMTVEAGKTLYDLAGDISGGLQRAALSAEVNGKVMDLTRTITEDASVNFLTFSDQKGRDTFRHTASHILAQAVKRLYPEAK